MVVHEHHLLWVLDMDNWGFSNYQPIPVDNIRNEEEELLTANLLGSRMVSHLH